MRRPIIEKPPEPFNPYAGEHPSALWHRGRDFTRSEPLPCPCRC